ncbi:YceI family protein [Fimbriiglobus ruber]|uniref:YceI n=1 Tax=Fimbriiglobus ruber TaxID=1908690 RepID=A0A225DHQ9_9BACT|nr:YceI family protein [Fimbriiglobus ruber]OWK40513.1 YceI [Fimbriiglobus ruber]
MRFLCGLTVAALCGALAIAAESKVALTGENTKIEFTGTKKEGKHDGGFKKLTGTATAEGTDPTTLKIDVTIETGSLYSDNAKLTEHLKAPDFFDVKTNPTAKFTSTKVEKDGEVYKVSGDLTINGKTKAISFPASVTVADGKLTLASEFKINRNDFGITYGAGKIDDDVALRIKVDAK